MKIILFSINLLIVLSLGQIGTIRRLSDPSKCLDVNFNSGDNVYIHACHNGNNQKFELGAADSDGYYNIKSKYNNECLDVHGEANRIVDAGDNVYTHPCHGGDNQKFMIDLDGNIIRNKANGRNYCLDTGDSNNNVHVVACNYNNGNQKLLFVTDEILTIESRYYNLKCLDVSATSSNDNAIIWTCHGGNNQKFRRSLPDSDGYYSLISMYNNECLDVNQGSNSIVDTTDNITTWPCHGGDNQKWNIGTVLIRIKAKGNYCLAVGSNNNIHVWGCNINGVNQRFSTEIIS